MRKNTIVFYTNTKYSVHYHAYINGDGNVYVRKRDTTGFGHDHVDVLRVEKGELEAHGNPHISKKIYREVVSSLYKAMQKILGVNSTSTPSVNLHIKDVINLYDECVKIISKGGKHLKE